jgi:hypothetical protein
MMCGGDGDPTVFFQVNTTVMQALWSGLPANAVTVVDVAAPVSGASDPFAAVKLGFQQAEAATAAAAVAAGATDGGAAAVLESYHGTLVPPFCSVAVRGFFSQFL